jgi:hypothetical protein
LTFNKAIIDANASFAHGQVYVALSRCKTLEGLILSSPVNARSVIRSGNIDAFNRYAEEIEPNEQQANDLRKNYFTKLLFEQFSYKEFITYFKSMCWLLNEYLKNLYPELTNEYAQVEERFRSEILTVSEQFRSQLQRLLAKTENPEDDAFLQERIQKAAAYFQEKNSLILQDLVDKTNIETDNREVRKKVNDALDLLQTEIRQKQKTLEVCLNKFSIPTYLNAKSKAVIGDENTNQKKKTEKKSQFKVLVSSDILHLELYDELRSWRLTLAQEQDVPAYIILSQMALVGITNLLPQNSKQLLQIQGIGKVTADRYGEEILQIVQECVNQYKYEVKEFVIVQKSEQKRIPKSSRLPYTNKEKA